MDGQRVERLEDQLMPVSQAIAAMRGKLTSQALADFAADAWREYRAALKRGDTLAAEQHEGEFDLLCKLFQDNQV